MRKGKRFRRVFFRKIFRAYREQQDSGFFDSLEASNCSRLLLFEVRWSVIRMKSVEELSNCASRFWLTSACLRKVTSFSSVDILGEICACTDGLDDTPPEPDDPRGCVTRSYLRRLFAQISTRVVCGSGIQVVSFSWIHSGSIKTTNRSWQWSKPPASAPSQCLSWNCRSANWHKCPLLIIEIFPLI